MEDMIGPGGTAGLGALLGYMAAAFADGLRRRRAARRDDDSPSDRQLLETIDRLTKDLHEWHDVKDGEPGEQVFTWYGRTMAKRIEGLNAAHEQALRKMSAIEGRLLELAEQMQEEREAFRAELAEERARGERAMQRLIDLAIAAGGEPEGGG